MNTSGVTATTVDNDAFFKDARNLCPSAAMDFLAPNEPRLTGVVKQRWCDFVVREGIPEHLESGRGKPCLSVGRESDFDPAELAFPAGYSEGRVWATMVKHGLTTWAARDWLARILRIKPNQINHTGLKDRRAMTAQMVEIQGVTPQQLRRVQWPLTQDAERRSQAGLFLKDIRPAIRPPLTRKGGHGLNHFEIVVKFEGMSQDAIEGYLRPRLNCLERFGYLIPNFFGAQRLGPRQIQHQIGQTAIAGGYPNRDGNPWTSNVEAAMFRFICESTDSEPHPIREIRRKCASKWLFDFAGMRQLLDECYKKYNLATEFKMAEYLAETNGDFNRVFRRMQEETSLWIGAWQSFWWNQVLIYRLPHWRKEMDLGARSKFKADSKRIPLLMDTQAAIKFYAELNLGFSAQALNEVEKAREAGGVVHDLFLLPRSSQGPSRNAFIKVDGFKCRIENGQAVLEFDLRSGAYATTLVGLLCRCNLDDQEDSAPAAAGAPVVQ